MKTSIRLSNMKWLTILPLIFFAGLLVYLMQAAVPVSGDGIHVDFSINKNDRNPPNCAENEALVIFKKGVNLDEMQCFTASRSLKIKRHFKAVSRIRGQHYVLVQSEDKATTALIGTLIREEPVDFVEANYRMQICAKPPNDPRFNELWGLHNTGQTGGTAGIDIDAIETWQRIGPTPSVIVAVIDTGINYNHPDLAANMWVNPDEIAGNGIDDEGNGYKDDIHGINALADIGEPANPMDDNGHGTHCAGIIGAIVNNGLDVAGVNPDVKLIAVKAFDVSGSGNYAGAVAAINYIIELKTTYKQNIAAINASFGGSDYCQTLEDTIAAAGEVGIIVCASAGNDYADNEISPFYPASYDGENIIAVTAVDHNGVQQYNYGAFSVDLAAPGFDILSTKAWYQPRPGDIFFDDLESGSAEWLTDGTKKWAITKNQEGFANDNFPIPSPPYFWSDSPGSDYASGTDSWLMLKEDLDLSGYHGQNLYLGFGAALAIEKKFDHAYVDVSGSSGGKWITLMDFSGYGFYWRPSYFFLIPEAVKTEHFRFRFRLTSDEQTEYWGWLLDDIGIGSTIVYGCELQSGTSMAVPYVTGAVAYIASLYPLDTVSQRVKRILDHATPLDSLSGKCMTGGLLNLDNAVGDPPRITVTSPLKDETYTIGQTLPVKWSSWGIDGAVRIKLVNADGKNSYTVTGSTAYDNTRYDYSIPCGVPVGSYMIRVEKPGSHSGDSGLFIIDSSPCITVSNPVGGETYYPGEPLSIEWDTWGISGDLAIRLIRSGQTDNQVIITPSVSYNKSPYLYTIPVGITGGSYYIGIKKKKPGEAFGKSAVFTIRPVVSGITVIEPAAGDVYKRGQDMTIVWLTSGISGKVTIQLKRTHGRETHTAADNEDYDAPQFTYQVPAGVTPGMYVVEVRQDPVYGVSGAFRID